MQINQEIIMHLDRRDTTAVVDAVQGETARTVTLQLFCGNTPWNIPADAAIMIRYRKQDCTGGVYDSMPDGSRAWLFRDNRAQIRIAPQALAVAGVTAMQIAIEAEGEELASFIFHLRVEADPSVGTLASEDYINIGQWLLPQLRQLVLQAQKAAEDARRAAEEAGRITAAMSSSYLLDYSLGAIDAATGEVENCDTAIVSEFFPVIGGHVGVTFPEAVTVRLFYYDRAMVYVTADLMQTEPAEHEAPENGDFARVEVRYANGMAVESVEELAGLVTVYTPNTGAADAALALEAAQQAETAAEAAAKDAQRAADAAEDAAKNAKGCVKSVNGEVPDEYGNVRIETSLPILKTLNINKVRHNDSKLSLLGSYDGTEETNITIPVGFSYRTSSGKSQIQQLDGPTIINGWWIPNNYKNDNFYFGDAYAFTQYSAGVGGSKKVYIVDICNNKQYLFEFLNTSAFGQYTVDIEPLVVNGGETGSTELQPLTFTGAVEAVFDGTEPVTVNIPKAAGGGGTWEKLGEITTTEEVSQISIPVGAEYKEIYIQAGAQTTTGGTTQSINVANFNVALIRSTAFFPGNNYRHVLVHLTLADGFAFGESTSASKDANGKITTQDISNALKHFKTPPMAGGFENVTMAVESSTFQAGAELIVWGCK